MRKLLMAGLFGTLALAIGCGGGGSSTSKTVTIATPTQNVQPIVVDGGPPGFIVANQGTPYVNGAFVTLTVCTPASTTSCNTIDHVLVDTGSYGLRILSSSSGGEFALSLPETTVGGNALGECVQFADTSYLWGPVEVADVKIAGEVASSIPVHVVGDTTFTAASPLPATCNNGSNLDDDSLLGLGANGILGVGYVQYDCGDCTTGTPPPGVYYQCPSSGCVPTLVTAAQEVQNPVGLFASDNNGVIVELPAASGPQASLSGSLVFGIGTQSNNALGSATVLPLRLDPSFGYVFTTTLSGSTMSDSFIDSGSNSLDFDDNSLTASECQDNPFYCPLTPTSLTATNSGVSGSSNVTFSVINADNVFNSFPNDAAVPGLAAPGNNNSISFDWGLPFFYGKNVFTSIAGTTAPGGQTPYWAY